MKKLKVRIEINSYFLFTWSILFFSCNSHVDVSIEKKNADNLAPKVVQKNLDLGEIDFSSPNMAQNLNILIPFEGDTNDNSNIIFHFCSLKAQAGCDPVGSESVNLVKSGSDYQASVNIGTSSLTPGDILKYKIIAADPDGINSEVQTGFLLIPYDATVSRGVRQLGFYSFGYKRNSKAGDFVYASAKDDNGNVYFAGGSSSSFGELNSGGADSIIVKLKANGTLDEEFGHKGILHIGSLLHGNAIESESIRSINLDNSGNIFVAGYTSSNLSGTRAAADYDIFVLKLNAQTGEFDSNFGDGDGADNDGILQINTTVITFSTGHDEVFTSLLDGSHLYVAGSTGGTGLGYGAQLDDVYIIKIDTTNGFFDTAFGNGDGIDNDGILKIGPTLVNSATGSERIVEMALDGLGNLFVTGNTQSSFGGVNTGFDDDVFVMKVNATTGVLDSDFGDGDGIDNDGVMQLNNVNTGDASDVDVVNSIYLDGAGNIYIAGFAASAFSGGAGAGGFVAKIDTTNGVLDTNFGDGDGADNDGILQLNATYTGAADLIRMKSMKFDTLGNMFLGLDCFGHWGGTGSGVALEDLCVAKIDSTNGALDTDFGDGDGSDNDGVVRFNTTNSNEFDLRDNLQSLLVDNQGDVVIFGTTYSSLGGSHNGVVDIVVSKLNSTSGVLDSTFGNGIDDIQNDGIVQFNIEDTGNALSDDFITAMALDGSGNMYLAGTTSSSMGGLNVGDFTDGFIAKIDASSGTFDTQFGDGDGSDNDGIVQFNHTKITGSNSENDEITSLIFDGPGSIFLGGRTSGSLGGTNAGAEDLFVLKIDTTNGLFDTSFGDGDGSDNDGIVQINSSNSMNATGSETLTSMKLLGGNLYLSGHSTGSLGGTNGGAEDGVIIKLDAASGSVDGSFGDGDGNDNDGIVQLNATNTADSSGADKLEDLVLDGVGNIFTVGHSTSAIGGTNGGGIDTFVVKLDSTSGALDGLFGDGDGTDNDGIVQVNSTNAGSATSFDEGHSLLLDGVGNIFVGGFTFSGLGGAAAGNYDIFVIKMDDSSGVFDGAFGDGDGVDDDGVLQLNALNTAAANQEDKLSQLVLDGTDLYIAGQSRSAMGATNAGTQDGVIVKVSASSGALDSDFGDGDGTDNDGVVQFNNTNTSDASAADFINAIALDGMGSLYISGDTEGSLEGRSSGGSDGFSIVIDTTDGSI